MPSYDCPTCRKIITVVGKENAPYRPFCCERCKLVDLGRWLDGTYTIADQATPDQFDEHSEQSEPAEDNDHRSVDG